jgi:hypothetical protein
VAFLYRPWWIYASSVVAALSLVGALAALFGLKGVKRQ